MRLNDTLEAIGCNFKSKLSACIQSPRGSNFICPDGCPFRTPAIVTMTRLFLSNRKPAAKCRTGDNSLSLASPKFSVQVVEKQQNVLDRCLDVLWRAAQGHGAPSFLRIVFAIVCSSLQLVCDENFC